MSLLSPGSYSLAYSFSFIVYCTLSFCSTSQWSSMSYQVRIANFEEEKSDLVNEM
ncbi:unnamed protein product [Hymenolepis diminuta]|uniref:Uncharacterized protein n=1 Tax=Hymenolepis diminuta TaxID=6216 RepID=A0A564Y0B5_HYMDI|nr:unnamed protein product [Hymenolepis diminuta]